MDFHPYGWATGPWELIDRTGHRQYEHGVPGDENRVLLQKGQTCEAGIPTGNGRNKSSAVLNCGERGSQDLATEPSILAPNNTPEE